jgi:hypothetical protein
VNRDPKKRGPYSADEFDPFVDRTPTKIKVGIEVLKAFVPQG